MNLEKIQACYNSYEKLDQMNSDNCQSGNTKLQKEIENIKQTLKELGKQLQDVDEDIKKLQ